MPGQDKFVYILGISDGEVFSFTISSQTKYLALNATRDQMVEIPFQSTNFLTRPSYIQCFYELTRTPILQFRKLEANGTINYRACRPEFLPSIARIVHNSELLPEEDVETVEQLLGRW